jgi:hypothetical protein
LVPVGETPVVLPAALAGEVDELTGRFAEHIGEGLMAASVAIGLDVLDRWVSPQSVETSTMRRCHVRDS